jgi:hypothetical protein
MYLGLTLLLGEMLHGPRNGPHADRLHFYVKVGRFDQFEQSKISILTVTSLAIVTLTVHHDLKISV